MALHITDADTDRLARDLAHATGETLTVAINKALKERLRLVSIERSVEREKFIAELTRIARGAKGLRQQRKTSRELIEDLYDENGLPR